MSQTFQDHFSGVANRYADFRPHYPAALFDYLATLAPRSSVVWDCAAGNGQATLDVAARFDKVIATDASREQIAAARPHPKIEYRVAPAEQSGLPDQSVALVTVAQALHWFDIERFYAEVRRVLVHGGMIAVWTYERSSVSPDMDAVFTRLYTGELEAYWPPERRHVEACYATLPFPFEPIAVPAFELRCDWTVDQYLAYLRSWSAAQRFLKATGRDAVAEIEPDMRAAWGDPAQARTVRWLMTVKAGRE